MVIPGQKRNLTANGGAGIETELRSFVSRVKPQETVPGLNLAAVYQSNEHSRILQLARLDLDHSSDPSTSHRKKLPEWTSHRPETSALNDRTERSGQNLIKIKALQSSQSRNLIELASDDDRDSHCGSYQTSETAKSGRATSSRCCRR
jgi:hypothetical protein